MKKIIQVSAKIKKQILAKNKEKQYTPDFERSKHGDITEYISFIVGVIVALDINVPESAYNSLPEWAKRHWKLKE